MTTVSTQTGSYHDHIHPWFKMYRSEGRSSLRDTNRKTKNKCSLRWIWSGRRITCGGSSQRSGVNPINLLSLIWPPWTAVAGFVVSLQFYLRWQVTTREWLHPCLYTGKYLLDFYTYELLFVFFSLFLYARFTVKAVTVRGLVAAQFSYFCDSKLFYLYLFLII